MALVKMYRDIPEVAGGSTEAMIPEDAVQSAIDNGWKKAEVKNEPKKEEAKAETPKVEVKKEEPKVEAKPEVKTDKVEQKAEGKK